MPPVAPFLADPGRGRRLLLPLAAVRDPLVVGHAEDVVACYREAMAAGAQFPPVAVVRLGGCYLLADGHKRLRAFRALLAAAPASGPAARPLPGPLPGPPSGLDDSGGGAAASGANPGDDAVVVIPVEWWTWRRWFADQLRQARGNLRKNQAIVRLLWRDPRAALALARTTFAHWRRVARSLASLAAGSVRAKRVAS